MDRNSHGMSPTYDKHTARDNEGKYFLLEERCKVKIKTKNVTQMKDTMQFYADFYEHPPPAPIFVVQSRIVQQCIEEHLRKFSDNIMNKVKSAHFNLHSDVISKEDFFS